MNENDFKIHFMDFSEICYPYFEFTLFRPNSIVCVDFELDPRQNVSPSPPPPPSLHM